MTPSIYAKEEDLHRHRILANGFIQHNEDWCYVYDIANYTLFLRRLKDNFCFTTDIQKESDKINFARPRMGYFNFIDRSYWTSINPAKQMQQSLKIDHIYLWDINLDKSVYKDLEDNGREIFLDFLNGNYPPFKECLKNVEKDWFSCAFSRTFSIVKKPNKKKGNTFLLYHTKDKVGHWSPRKNIFIIDETFKTNLLENILNTYKVPYK